MSETRTHNDAPEPESREQLELRRTTTVTAIRSLEATRETYLTRSGTRRRSLSARELNDLDAVEFQLADNRQELVRLDEALRPYWEAQAKELTRQYRHADLVRKLQAISARLSNLAATIDLHVEALEQSPDTDAHVRAASQVVDELIALPGSTQLASLLRVAVEADGR